MGAPSLDHLLLELPRCARCGGSVERLEQRLDPLVVGRVVTVECHGDREVSIVRDDDLRAALPHSFRYVVAFPLPERDLRDSAFAEPRPFKPSFHDAFEAWAYVAYRPRRYEPPEGS